MVFNKNFTKKDYGFRDMNTLLSRKVKRGKEKQQTQKEIMRIDAFQGKKHLIILFAQKQVIEGLKHSKKLTKSILSLAIKLLELEQQGKKNFGIGKNQNKQNSTN